jgi:hypothetical protein
MFEKLEPMNSIGLHYFKPPTDVAGYPEVFERVRAGEVVARAAQVRADWEKLIGTTAPSEKDAATPAESVVRDVRVMPVVLDPSGDRHRDLSSAAAVCATEELEDWPLDAVRNAGYILKEHKRRNRSFTQTHSEWVASSGIRTGDRAVVEHMVLSQSLDLAVQYDQLNVANLASMEVIASRRMVLEDAYRGSPEHPRFAGAEHIMGFRTVSGGEVFNPAAGRVRAQRMKAETDQDKERRLQKEEAAHKR